MFRMSHESSYAIHQEDALCKAFGFTQVATAQTSSLTFGSISSAANRVHEELEKGTYLSSPVVKFFNFKLPQYHDARTEILLQAKMLGIPHVNTTTKMLKVYRQKYTKIGDKCIYVYDATTEKARTSYNIFPKFQKVNCLEAHCEYWSAIEAGEDTLYSSEITWEGLFKKVGKVEDMVSTDVNVPPNWWWFNSPDQNLIMAHEPTRTHSGSGYSHLYLGRKHSTFTWHVEPSDIPSVSVLHAGSPKIWYVPHPMYLTNVKDFVWSEIGENNDYDFHNCDAFFEHRWTHINPARLVTEMNAFDCSMPKRFPVAVVVQEPRCHLLIPWQTLHQGFSTGDNIGEAIGMCTLPAARHLAEEREATPCDKLRAKSKGKDASLELNKLIDLSEVMVRPPKIHTPRMPAEEKPRCKPKAKRARYTHIKTHSKQ